MEREREREVLLSLVRAFILDERGSLSGVFFAHTIIEARHVQATNFILIGSTKIVAVIVTYFDFFLGMPTRFLANQLWQRTVATDEDANDADLIKGALSALTQTTKNRVTKRQRAFCRNLRTWLPQKCCSLRTFPKHQQQHFIY